MNWKAIGLGVAVGIGGALAMNLVWRVFPFDASEKPIWLLTLLSYGMGILIDLAVGATAGWWARTRGALHGLIAGALANLVSPFIGLAIVWVETRGEIPFGLLGYFGQMAIGGVVGIALATIAGEVAARLAAASPRR